MKMKLKGKEFKAVVATPTAGKSYLCDRYSIFVDADELRLFSKYFIPDGITREELEKTKGVRPYPKRDNFEKLYKENLNKVIEMGKILICSPHPELKDFLFKNKIPYLFVYPKKSLKNNIKQRMINRGNCSKIVKENDDLFYKYYYENNLEPYAIVKYRFKKNEYLSDILKKAGVDFNKLDKKL